MLPTTSNVRYYIANWENVKSNAKAYNSYAHYIDN